MYIFRYCGWAELAPFWAELVPDRAARVLVPGVGSDPAAPAMFDAGWRHLTCFDYSAGGVSRARSLFAAEPRPGVVLLCADARALPLPDAAFDAALDKGTLDAIFLSDREGGALSAACAELSRVVAPGGLVLSLARVVPPASLLAAFESEQCWETLIDGELHFAESGEASIDLGAPLFAWRRL